MNRIKNWIQKRKTHLAEKSKARIRGGTKEEKEAFLGVCLLNAYYPLATAMTTLQAKNFVEGTIHEQTTGEWFRIEMRKIDPPEKG